MIIVAWNEVLNGIDLMVDAAGVELLIERLTKLRNERSGHLHIDDVALTSPGVTLKSPKGSSSTGSASLISSAKKVRRAKATERGGDI